jgi:hypothetical protein
LFDFYLSENKGIRERLGVVMSATKGTFENKDFRLRSASRYVELETKLWLCKTMNNKKIRYAYVNIKKNIKKQITYK